jgi:RHH-type transcriptional regulator, rel operon repressor / antitoxin RelB
MLALRLPPELEERLNNLAKRTGRTKSYYAKLAIEEFLEDQEDYLIAMERLQEKLPALSLDEVERLLGLEDED